MGETAERYELIDGVVFMSPSPTPPHSEIALEVQFQVKAFIRSGGRARVFAETDVRLSSGLVYRPDIVVYRSDRLPAGKLARLDLPPDLVIEVLSPSTKPYDLVTKRGDYERFGAREYWVVDPDDASVRCWGQGGGVWTETLVTGDTLESAAIPGFVLDIRPLRTIARGE